MVGRVSGSKGGKASIGSYELTETTYTFTARQTQVISLNPDAPIVIAYGKNYIEHKDGESNTSYNVTAYTNSIVIYDFENDSSGVTLGSGVSNIGGVSGIVWSYNMSDHTLSITSGNYPMTLYVEN